jgi:hypothetical protein
MHVNSRSSKTGRTDPMTKGELIHKIFMKVLAISFVVWFLSRIVGFIFEQIPQDYKDAAFIIGCAVIIYLVCN